MAELALFRALDWPPLYRITQAVLAPGARHRLESYLRDLSEDLGCTGPSLDVGCGPRSWLTAVGLRPIGLDLAYPYASTLRKGGTPAVTGSATDLPFEDASIGSVWSIGVLHHLNDDMARAAVREMVRVARPGGAIVIFDGVLPTLHARPVVWLLRKLDRGRYMRTQSRLQSLLNHELPWSCKRLNYSFIGHEGVLCVARPYQAQ
jgi:SAM-dependent methyltransferase